MDPYHYYTVRKVPTPHDQSSFVKHTWDIAKFSGHKEPDEVGTVRQFHSGRFDSDDYGYQYHKNEFANKRINIVKRHIELGQPLMTAYWHDDKGKIEHHTTEIHPSLKHLL